MTVTREEYEEAVKFLMSSPIGWTGGDMAEDAVRAAERQAEAIIEEWAEQNPPDLL